MRRRLVSCKLLLPVTIVAPREVVKAMHFNKRIVKLMAILFLAIAMVMSISPVTVEASSRPRLISKQQRVLFIKEELPYALEFEEEYQIPHEFVLAIASGESYYGTSDFAVYNHNLTGYACYPEEEGGPVICHKTFESDEECLRRTFELLADDYGLRGMYMNNIAGIASVTAATYSGNTPGYVDYICDMVDTVNSLEGEVVAMQEAEEAAAAEEATKESARREQILVALGGEEILIKDRGARTNGLTAGANAMMAEMMALKEITVEDAANQVLAGNFGDYAERREILGVSYGKVQAYIEYTRAEI